VHISVLRYYSITTQYIHVIDFFIE